MSSSARWTNRLLAFVVVNKVIRTNASSASDETAKSAGRMRSAGRSLTRGSWRGVVACGAEAVAAVSAPSAAAMSVRAGS
jgi:hypothetical protein